MEDMDMAMAMAVGFEDLDQVMLAISPGSSATSSAPAATAVLPTATRGVSSEEDDDAAAATDLRRGPWTVDEDILLVNYIAAHGEGRWNSLARSAGLKRTGKSCRLRWLNYLRPDVRRGNITAEEQLLILELHSRWGNRWSKIAACLPGRTDNEIKNYWRTRVQKHAKHLRCDVNSAGFRHVVRHVWMPRLRERAAAGDVQAAAAGRPAPAPLAAAAGVQQAAAPAFTTASAPPACQHLVQLQQQQQGAYYHGVPAASEAADHHHHHHHQYYSEPAGQTAAAAAALSPDDASSALRAPPPASLPSADDASHWAAAYTSATPTKEQGCGSTTTTTEDDVFAGASWSELLATATAGPDDVDHSSSVSVVGLPDFGGFGDVEDGLWSLDDDLCLQQLC